MNPTPHALNIPSIEPWHPAWCQPTGTCDLDTAPADRDHESQPSVFNSDIDAESFTFRAAVRWWAIGSPDDAEGLEVGLALTVENREFLGHHARLHMSPARARALGQWLIGQADQMQEWVSDQQHGEE